jgi:hypothetical protein
LGSVHRLKTAGRMESLLQDRHRVAAGDDHTGREIHRVIETLGRCNGRWKTPVEWVESSRDAASPTEMGGPPALGGGSLIGKKVSQARAEYAKLQ